MASRALNLRVVYDETKYIASAIDLVQQNIWIGGMLALGVLLLFLRSALPTVIVFAAIPVSVIGTFVAIAGLGLSINVISLAGLAFAVGMVVDASIVSLENIFRLRQRGLPADTAAYHGARQVWAPILGSALTTVIVFIPVLLLTLPVGQLFRDIGIAISVSVLISVVVSVTVIPALAARLLRGPQDRYARLLPIPGLDHLASGFARLVVSYARLSVRRSLVGVLAVSMLGGVGRRLRHALHAAAGLSAGRERQFRVRPHFHAAGLFAGRNASHRRKDGNSRTPSVGGRAGAGRVCQPSNGSSLLPFQVVPLPALPQRTLKG